MAKAIFELDSRRSRSYGKKLLQGDRVTLRCIVFHREHQQAGEQKQRVEGRGKCFSDAAHVLPSANTGYTLKA